MKILAATAAAALLVGSVALAQADTARPLASLPKDGAAVTNYYKQNVYDPSDTKIGEVSTDLTGAKGDITATKQDLEATKANLTSTIGDLGVQSGLIARNQEDLEQLKRQGERRIFEIHLTKSKTSTHVGPIQLTLTKTDPKKSKYTMTVLADDKTIEKKDKTAEEPVQFYVKGTPHPYEIVIFDVTKDNVNGYLSLPKDTGPIAKAQ